MMHSDASPKSPRAELWQEVCEVADWRSLGSPEDRAKLRTLASGARWEDLVPAESRARRVRDRERPARNGLHRRLEAYVAAHAAARPEYEAAARRYRSERGDESDSRGPPRPARARRVTHGR